jgi:hypothetical protein
VLRVSVFGSGGGADIAVTPVHLYFGLVPLGAPARRSLIVTNVGFEPLEVTEIRFEPEVPAFSLIDVDPIPFSLGPGEPRLVEIEFEYQAEGDLETRLVIESDDFDESRVEVIVRAG